MARKRKGHHRSRRRNPGSLAHPLGAIKSKFSVGALKEALPVAGGIALNAWASGMLAPRLPAILSTGIGSYATGLALAGASGLIPKYGSRLAAGGVVFQVLRALNQYVVPGAVRIGEYLAGDGDDIGGELGLGELMQPAQLGMGELLDPAAFGALNPQVVMED